MGSSLSVLSKPSLYATAVKDSPDADKWTRYDYVVVGGGTAGCVLAARLSEDPKVKVLLLEAGKGYDDSSAFMTRIPIAAAKTLRSMWDWDYQTTPQAALDNREIYCARGKGLGGSSAINYLIFQHCPPEDFDAWEREGATGWSYKDLLPYFMKMEGYSATSSTPKGLNAGAHGTLGPLQTRFAGVSDMDGLVMKACANAGVPYVVDLNTPKDNLGATHFLSTIDAKGHRSSTATAYLTPEVLSRPNLTVAVGVTAEKIHFSKDATPRAVGVEISTGVNTPHFGVSGGEIILCAGAIATPQLLLLSGIGPTAELEKLKIPVVLDSPAVGKHLADHISCGPLTFRAKPGTTWDHLSKPLDGLVALSKWLAAGKGPMSGLGTPGGAFIRSDDPSLSFYPKGQKASVIEDITSGPRVPDIELVWAPMVFLNFGFTEPPPGCHGITMGGIVLRPKSLGTITLKTTSVWDKPAIDGRWLESESDMNVALHAVRFILKLARTDPLSSMLDLVDSEKQHPFYWPGSADPETVTDDELKAWLRKNAAPAFHPTSTARIGASIQTSVVDPQLRVHGVQGLRIMDASVFPTQLSGHPCAPIIAMAERAAVLIRA